MAEQPLKILDYDKLEIGEELGYYEYALTQGMPDNFRPSIDRPEACFPTGGRTPDATALNMGESATHGAVKTGTEM